MMNWRSHEFGSLVSSDLLLPFAGNGMSTRRVPCRSFCLVCSRSYVRLWETRRQQFEIYLHADCVKSRNSCDTVATVGWPAMQNDSSRSAGVARVSSALAWTSAASESCSPMISPGTQRSSGSCTCQATPEFTRSSCRTIDRSQHSVLLHVCIEVVRWSNCSERRCCARNLTGA